LAFPSNSIWSVHNTVFNTSKSMSQTEPPLSISSSLVSISTS
jgi:hypothetical protein